MSFGSNYTRTLKHGIFSSGCISGFCLARWIQENAVSCLPGPASVLVDLVCTQVCLSFGIHHINGVIGGFGSYCIQHGMTPVEDFPCQPHFSSVLLSLGILKLSLGHVFCVLKNS